MDPEKLQSDPTHDAHSLETPSDALNAESKSQEDQAEAQKPQLSRPIQKLSWFQRLWQKFNVYLLLYILIVIIAITVTIVLFVKNRNTTQTSKDIIDTQSLSEASQAQLSNTSVNIGSSKQILSVQSNAIFSGSMLVRGELEVAGTIKAGGDLQLPGITVSGASRFGQLQTENIAIAGSATVQGSLVAKQGISVTGSSSFDGILSAAQLSTNALQLNGDLTLTHHIVAGGPIPGLSRGGALGSGGTASVSGSDTAGSITINTGGSPGAGCFVTIDFVRRYNGTPHVIITPVGSGAAGLNYFVNRSTTEFSICATNSAPGGQTFGFDYMVLD